MLTQMELSPLLTWSQRRGHCLALSHDAYAYLFLFCPQRPHSYLVCIPSLSTPVRVGLSLPILALISSLPLLPLSIYSSLLLNLFKTSPALLRPAVHIPGPGKTK